MTPISTDLVDYPAARSGRCPFDPPPALHDLQQQTPLTRVRLSDGTTPWLVTRYADQRRLMADPRVSADVTQPGYPNPAVRASASPKDSPISFILMDDPDHARLRRMVTAPFSIRRVEAMRPAVQKIVDDLIDQLLAGPNPTDLVDAFALPVPSLVICELLGVPYADHDFFQINSKAIVSRDSTPGQSGDGMANLGAYLGRLVAAKQTDPADDVLSRLAGKVTDGELSISEAVQMSVLLLIAGHETTANMIALGTIALLQNPDQLALLRDSDDPKVVTAAVEELLRYLHITHNGRRRVALDDLELDGRVITAGEGIIFPNDIGNRDLEAFADPDTLDVTRDARHHVAFGFGIHQCLGQPLARMELQVVYSTLYRRIPTLALAVELDEIPFKHDAAVYGVHAMSVRW